MKRCWKCKEEKEINEYYKNRTQPDGYEGLCKICKGEYNKNKGFSNWEYKKTNWKGKGDFGIYKITNNISNEVYIGKGWLVERQYDHFWKLKNNKHDNPWFQKSYNLNPNQNNFTFLVLEKCSMEDGLVLERDYIIQEYY